MKLTPRPCTVIAMVDEAHLSHDSLGDQVHGVLAAHLGDVREILHRADASANEIIARSVAEGDRVHADRVSGLIELRGALDLSCSAIEGSLRSLAASLEEWCSDELQPGDAR